MKNYQIDKEIEILQNQKHINKINKSLKEYCYDTLFFTYEPKFKHKVHFAHLVYESTYDCYVILCKGGDWLHDGKDDEGHHLDMVKLLKKEAVFMNWDEAIRDVCHICSKYLSLNQVITNYTNALRAKGDKIVELALSKQIELNEWANKLDGLSPT